MNAVESISSFVVRMTKVFVQSTFVLMIDEKLNKIQMFTLGDYLFEHDSPHC